MKNILYPFLLLGILFSCADDKKTEETIYKLDNRHNEFPIEIEEIIIKEKNILRIMINKKEQVLIENDYSRIYYITDKVIEFIDNGGGYDLDECDYCNGAADPRSSDNPIKAIVALSIDNIEEHRYLYFKSLIEDGYNYLRNKVSLKKYNQSYDSMVSNYYDRYWQGDRSLLRDKIYLIRSLYPINLTSELAPPPPEVIEIVEDEEEIEETVIESTETDQEDEEEIEETVIESTETDQEEEIEIEEAEEDIEVVPFSVIENAPIFPGCDKGNNAERRKCMSQKITKFVQIKFNTDLAGDLGLTGRQRISVIFKIDKNGDVVGFRARAPHPRLVKEAQRVINLLPKMKPGRQRGKAVIVSYSLPIIFQVQD